MHSIGQGYMQLQILLHRGEHEIIKTVDLYNDPLDVVPFAPIGSHSVSLRPRNQDEVTGEEAE